MSWQDNMVKELNRSLSPPFMPEGFAKARIFQSQKGNILNLQIGDRDIDFDENGNGVGSGSNVGSAIQWAIQRLEVPYPPVFAKEK